MEKETVTNDGIKKLISGLLPVTLQVSRLFEKQMSQKNLRGTLISEYGDKDSFKRVDEVGYIVPSGVRSFVLDDGSIYVENPHEEMIDVLPRFHVSDGIHEVQCIVRSTPADSGNDICVLGGDGCNTIVLYKFITIYEAVGSWCRGNTGVVEIQRYKINSVSVQRSLIGTPIALSNGKYCKLTTFCEEEEVALTLNWCNTPRTYTGGPGLRLQNGKWILHDGEMTNEESYSLINL